MIKNTIYICGWIFALIVLFSWASNWLTAANTILVVLGVVVLIAAVTVFVAGLAKIIITSVKWLEDF